MPRKIELKEEEIELMRYLYKEKCWSIRRISKVLDISRTTIRNKIKKHIGLDRRYAGFGQCPICKTRFGKDVHGQVYCSDSCQKIGAEEKRRAWEDRQYSVEKYKKYLKYISIVEIRKEFWRLIKSNPKKALAYYQEMKKEEGEEFTMMTLGTIINSNTFKEMSAVYQKFQTVFEADIPEARL